MNPFVARAGVDSSRLGGYSPFYEGRQLSGSMYAYGGQLGADALITPSLENWTAEDARMLDILGSKGTNSPEGKALIAELEAQYGTGNWYPAWAQMQDELTAKYNAAQSDAERLAALQASTTEKDYGEYVPAGAIPYSLHDLNAYNAMTAEQQAEFLLGFTDPNAAGYFSANGETKPGVQEMMDAARGIKYMGADGKLYDTYEDMVAAGQTTIGTVTSVTTATGEVITDPERLKTLTHEEVFGTPSEPVTGGFDPSSAFTPVTTVDEPKYTDDGKPVPVLAPNGIAPPTGQDDFSSLAPTAPSPSTAIVPTTVNVKGQPKNIDWNTALQVPAPALAPEDEIPVVQAGIGGGMLGMLALGGLALAVFMAPKRGR